MSDKIDVEELAAWVASMVHKKLGFAVTDAEEERRLRAAVIAAVDSGAPEIVVALTLNGPSGPVAIEERLTRMAAENLFAPSPPGHEADRKRFREDQRERDAAEARRHAARGAPKPSRPTREVENAESGLPRIGKFVIVAIVLAVAAVVYFASRDERHEDDDKRDKHEMHHAR